MFKNKYGYFSESGREYIITNPRTPRPWFNYLWNDKFSSMISHTGGGFSFYETPRDNRLTRMRYNCLPWDRPGRYVIIKDLDNDLYWSLSWAPTTNINYDKYECHFGQGYVKIITEFNKIRGEILYFINDDLDVEIWNVKLINLSSRKRKLEVYSFVELLMGNALNDLINQPNDKHFTEIIFNKEKNTLEATRRYWVLNKKVSVSQPNLDWKYKLYFTQTLPISGFDSSLDSFIGRWRSETNPISIETGKMKNNEITAGDPVFALKSNLILQPKSEKIFNVLFGIAPKDEKKPYERLRWKEFKYKKFAWTLFNKLTKKWDNIFDHIKIETPDNKFNLMLNIWNHYQTNVTFEMARNSGYYHGGLLFGTGIRDQFQDILGVVISNPTKVRSRLLNALRFQFSDGSTLHNFFKLTDWGEKTNHSDTPLWIPFGIIEYLNETGDVSFLDEIVSFYDKGEATVYTHLIRALDYCIKNTTKRNLPKIWNGDWNDTLDKIGPKGKGETIWGGFFLAYCLNKSFELLEERKDYKKLNEWKKFHKKIYISVNKYAWDGEWFIRAFKDNGQPVGVKKNKQGKIFINSQSWAVISGLTNNTRIDSCLNSLRKYLSRENGFQICWPSYTKIEDDIGLISRCVPGKKENGAIFNHASAWAVMAFLMKGDINFGYDMYHRMLPINTSKRIDRYEVEPFVYAEYITSPDHITEGQASHSWLTGSAVWMFRIGLDYILGFQSTLHGIKIDPHIPSSWKNLKVARKFRNKTINLVIENPDGKNKGFKEFFINDILSDSNFIEIDKYKMNVINIKIKM